MSEQIIRSVKITEKMLTSKIEVTTEKIIDGKAYPGTWTINMSHNQDDTLAINVTKEFLDDFIALLNRSLKD